MFVAGRVFLQLPQDFLHAGFKDETALKQQSAEGGSACPRDFMGAMTATASPNPPREGDDSFLTASQ